MSSAKRVKDLHVPMGATTFVAVCAPDVGSALTATPAPPRVLNRQLLCCIVLASTFVFDSISSESTNSSRLKAEHFDTLCIFLFCYIVIHTLNFPLHSLHLVSTRGSNCNSVEVDMFLKIRTLIQWYGLRLIQYKWSTNRLGWVMIGQLLTW